MAKPSRSIKGKTKDLIKELTGENGIGRIEPIDPSRYKDIISAEAAIRNLLRERLLVYENTSKSPTAAFQGNASQVAFDPRKTSKSSVVTHNHPDNIHGGTFSFKDMGNMLGMGWRGHNAVAKEGTYYLRPSKNANSEGFIRRLVKDKGKLKRQIQRKAIQLERKTKKGELSKKQVDNMLRAVATGVLHRYYKDTAPQYGYVYGRAKTNKTRR